MTKLLSPYSPKSWAMLKALDQVFLNRPEEPKLGSKVFSDRLELISQILIPSRGSSYPSVVASSQIWALLRLEPDVPLGI